jgi:hypothetical protein
MINLGTFAEPARPGGQEMRDGAAGCCFLFPFFFFLLEENEKS